MLFILIIINIKSKYQMDLVYVIIDVYLFHQMFDFLMYQLLSLTNKKIQNKKKNKNFYRIKIR